MSEIENGGWGGMWDELVGLRAQTKRLEAEVADWQKALAAWPQLQADLDRALAQEQENGRQAEIYLNERNRARSERDEARAAQKLAEAYLAVAIDPGNQYQNDLDEARYLARKYYRMAIDMQLRYGLSEYTRFRHGEPDTADPL